MHLPNCRYGFNAKTVTPDRDQVFERVAALRHSLLTNRSCDGFGQQTDFVLRFGGHRVSSYITQLYFPRDYSMIYLSRRYEMQDGLRWRMSPVQFPI